MCILLHYKQYVLCKHLAEVLGVVQKSPENVQGLVLCVVQVVGVVYKCIESALIMLMIPL